MLGIGNNFAAALNGVDVAGSTQCQTCNRIITFYGYIPSEFYCPNCGQSLVILMIITVPFVLVFEGSNRVFQFLADFNQKCSEVLTDNIVSGIYHFITDLIIKFTEDNQ